MTDVTIELSDREIKMLEARTGERSAEAALKASVGRANPKRTVAEFNTALKESLTEELGGRGTSVHQRPHGHPFARELSILPRIERDCRRQDHS